MNSHPNSLTRWAFPRLGALVLALPGGSSVLSSGVAGRVSREFNASTVMWDFFKALPMQ